jgi:hypothetical protein
MCWLANSDCGYEVVGPSTSPRPASMQSLGHSGAQGECEAPFKVDTAGRRFTANVDSLSRYCVDAPLKEPSAVRVIA